MTVTNFLIVLTSVTLSALAQTSFKYGVRRIQMGVDTSLFDKAATMLFSPYVIGGLSLYGIGTILWLFALRRMDLTLAYPFVAMSFVMVLASGVFILGEPVSFGRITGVFLIVAGLIVISQSA